METLIVTDKRDALGYAAIIRSQEERQVGSDIGGESVILATFRSDVAISKVHHFIDLPPAIHIV